MKEQTDQELKDRLDRVRRIGRELHRKGFLNRAYGYAREATEIRETLEARATHRRLCGK